jgi:DNA-binding MarR family transcriptional regulator
MKRRSLPQTTCYWFAHACKLLRARAHDRLGEVCLHGGQQFILCALWEEEGVTQSALAERLHKRPATVTNALQCMEKAGLVERRQDEEDQRVSRVYLTGAGRDIRAVVESTWGELEEQVFAGFSAEERELFDRLLRRVSENLIGR